jgi:transcriptional regulator with XRE-family HTH domain
MSKWKTDGIENCGQRLASLRKAVGYTQVEFAAEVGITQRKVKRLATNSLDRRMLAIEKLDPKAKRQVTQLLDTFIEREQLKQRVNSQGNAQRSTQGA